MCTHETKQNYYFLEAFNESKLTVGKGEIYDKIRELSLNDSVKCTYFLSAPRTLDQLFESASFSGFVKPSNGFGWKITEKGLRQKKYLKKRFIDPLNTHLESNSTAEDSNGFRTSFSF